MADKVDVLAVLDEAQDWLYRSSECRGDDERAAAVKEARAAVAELIEAAAEFENYAGDAGSTTRKINARKRFRAALATLGGSR